MGFLGQSTLRQSMEQPWLIKRSVMPSALLFFDEARLGSSVRVVPDLAIPGFSDLHIGQTHVRICRDKLPGPYSVMNMLDLHRVPNAFARAITRVTSVEQHVVSGLDEKPVRAGRKYRSKSGLAWAEVTSEVNWPLCRVSVSISAKSIKSWQAFRDTLLFRENATVVEQIAPTKSASITN